MQKIYQFYGWKNVGDIVAKTDEYPGVHTPYDLYDRLENIWSAETCAPRMRQDWTRENKTMGQCSITAFLAQDIFGGNVFAMPTDNGGVHCYNVVDGVIFDLTSEQFLDKSKDLVYDMTLLQDRESDLHFKKDEKRARYESIKNELARVCHIER
ncbi:MAG: hypothetical protein PUA62_01555 [Lachnospiraceae bacterium]|nr:hypothetical protein [Lachnospiraceae bacterium]